ncbi:MAG: aminoglycoside phosphotransferase family protein [Myxococcota bacterium]|nr:aminoglycoside phosphotransferase family protein [Myxococcota bacterium]
MGPRRRRHDQDEPSFDTLEFEHVGGELIFVVDRTEWGFPYGPTRARIRRGTELEMQSAGWARAKRALRETLEREDIAVSDIGRVTKIRDGLSREVYAASVEHVDGTEQAYAVLLPTRDADADTELEQRTLREVRLVADLRRRRLPFRVPAILGGVREGRHTVLIRHFVRGVPLDLRAGRQPSVQPWAIVGEIAAAVHAIPGGEVEDITPGFATRREHALDQLAVLDGLAPAEMRAALAWARDHLPPDEPATLVHGDLLGQNILLSLDGPHHVIDWEYALRGDPAYDLAIVTRGAKRPFQIAGGLARLLDAYEAHGGRRVAPEQVRIHEIGPIALAYREAVAGRSGQTPAFELDRMRSLVRRLG